MIAQIATNIRREASRAAVAGLTLLSAALPGDADPILDPHGKGTLP